MKLWASYIRDRQRLEVIETEGAFLTWRREHDGTFYIRDIYVHPDFRRTGVATRLADQVLEIAKAEKAPAIYGSVDPNDSKATESIQTLISWKMRCHSFNYELKLLIFRREVENG